MSLRSLRARRVLYPSLVLLAVAGGAAGGVAFAGSSDKPDSHEYAHGVTEQGLTWGSLGDAKSVDDEPDLVLVVADNGLEGYVYSDQLNPPDFETPGEAGRWTREVSTELPVIPVYETDGKTQIGTFTIG